MTVSAVSSGLFWGGGWGGNEKNLKIDHHKIKCAVKILNSSGQGHSER